MVIFCLLYVLETRDVLHAYQSEFRIGRSTIDAVICLENEIKESSSENKNGPMSILWHRESLWHGMEGSNVNTIKSNGKLFNWIMIS